MPIRRPRLWILPVLVLAWGVSDSAVAEDTGRADGEVTDEVSQVSEVPSELPGSREPSPPEAPEISDADKATRGAEAVGRMKEILTTVVGYLGEARDEADVVKLNCINEKLTSIKGLLKISEQADVNLQEAIARRDSDVSHHEFEKITIASRKCEQLLAESEACVGELAVYSGDTEVEVEITGAPPDQEEEFFPELVEIGRPPAASPYQ